MTRTVDIIIRTADPIVHTIHTHIPLTIATARIDRTVLTGRIVPIIIMHTMMADISQDIPHTGTISHKSTPPFCIPCNRPIGHPGAAGASELPLPLSHSRVESLRAERQASC